MKRYFSFAVILILLVFCQSLCGQNYKDILFSRAESGDLNSQKYLAQAFFEGKGNYTKNLSESFKWISKAAEQGDGESLYMLYNYYLNGIGCEKSNRLDLLLDAAARHYPKALLEAGTLLSQLIGKEEEGRAMLIEAYNLGEIGALTKLGVNLMCNNDYPSGVHYFNKAIEECKGIDLADAFWGLSIAYREGIGVPINLKYAHELIEKAISVYPSKAQYYEDNGIIYLRDGKMKEAAEMWNKTVTTSLVYAEQSTSELARAMNQSVDYGIPLSTNLNSKSYAIIIANENYKRVPNVPYALNDGRIFQKYLVSTFGMPEKNIEMLEDASLNDIKFAINNIAQKCQAFKDELSVIVYYAGHGVPDDKTAEAFLLPVDGFGTDPSSGLNLDDFYASLSEMPAKSIIVLLDACFSGTKRDGGMLMATRGITIKPKMYVPDGKLIVLSATSSDETAFPIEKQKHGLFTYTLLRKIQESGGDITWGELADYVTETVKKRSIDLNGKLQTPTVSVSPSIKENWRDIKIR